MQAKPILKNAVAFTIACVLMFSSCSKKDTAPPPTPDPCAGKNIVITSTATGATGCTSGSIAVTATGSTSFTYKLNSSGTYQATGTFTNVTAGAYTVFAKDGAGCENSASVAVAEAGAAGPLFTEVKALVATKCQSCHNNAFANGGKNWQVECNIVTNSARIKVRAVDLGTMPPTGPLSQAEKDKITNWITAGGGFGN